LEWEKLHAAATRAISDYEIYELALAAEKAKLKIELVDQGLPVWRAEMTLVLASVNHETDIGKAVLALRKAREDKEKPFCSGTRRVTGRGNDEDQQFGNYMEGNLLRSRS